jgi:phenylalanyl-tRNA synthetase beta chain
VSGLDEKTVNEVSSIMVTSLAERGGVIETVTEIYPQNKKIVSPPLEIKKITVKPAYIEKVLGIQLKPEKIVNFLMKMRFTAIAGPKGISIAIPPYRFDILHPIDIVEEIAIAYGLNNFETRLPKTSTIGSLHPIQVKKDRVRDIMVGLGFQEILTYILSSEDAITKKMNVEESNYVRISNPVSSEFSVMRDSLLPKGMDFLSKNKHIPLPQKIFEISEVVEVAKDEPTRTKTQVKLCAVVEDSATGFTDITSYFDALVKNLGLKYKLKKSEHQSLIPGRTAQITGSVKGVIGELHPQVLLNFELENPVSCFEIYV